jgi:hypothetical protein
MRPFSFAGVAATIFFLSGCGTEIPEGSPQGPPTAEQRAALTVPCAACAFITDPGQKQQCLTCCNNPNAFAGCGAAGSANPLFDTASCQCVSSCTPPALKVGNVCCGAGGQICKQGTSDVCVLPGSPPPAGTVCTPVCKIGETLCNNVCKNLQTDVVNCGACGNACPAGQACSNGACCPAGQTNCNGTCVDLATDLNNCGACGTSCGPPTAASDPLQAQCVAGKCAFCDNPTYWCVPGPGDRCGANGNLPGCPDLECGGAGAIPMCALTHGSRWFCGGIIGTTQDGRPIETCTCTNEACGCRKETVPNGCGGTMFCGFDPCAQFLGFRWCNNDCACHFLGIGC